MHINILEVIVIIVLACLAWYTNEQLNTVPVLKQVVRVLIVVISVLMLLATCGLLGSNASITIGA